MKTKVWVVMGNDYPDAVFSTKDSADRYVDGKKKTEPSEQCAGYKAFVHWQAYEFEVQS